MPQHLWHYTGHHGQRRYCEVCHRVQKYERQTTGGRYAWMPPCSPICPGDDEDGGQGGPRRVRPKPLEDA
jgi:hypothetical protein